MKLRSVAETFAAARAQWAQSRLRPTPQLDRLFGYERAELQRGLYGGLVFSAAVCGNSTWPWLCVKGMAPQAGPGLMVSPVPARGGTNARVSELILLLGFPYIASVTWQYGLRLPTLGGLWLNQTYSGVRWDANPVWTPPPVVGHTASALSVATFLTLLARDAFPGSSFIKSILELPCSRKDGFFSGLEALGNRERSIHKCGYWGPYAHEAVYVERDGRRYVAVVLTKSAELSFKDFIQQLDGLIRRNS